MLLHRRELEDGVDRLALGLADEAARVDHDDLGVRCVIGEGKPRILGDPEHDLALSTRFFHGHPKLTK